MKNRESENARVPPSGGSVQLRMRWPEARLGDLPPVALAAGYRMRPGRPSDAGGYVDLMRKAGFEDWEHESVEAALKTVLSDGWFVVEAEGTGELVATALANHRPLPEHPFAGELGWVASAPDHRGKRLGRSVCAAVLHRFVQGGYRVVYLFTDSFRLPALAVYFQLGFVPDLSQAGMADQWKPVLERLREETPKLKGGVAER